MVGALGTAGSVGLGAAAGLAGSAGCLGGVNGANGLGPGRLELNAFNSYLGQTDVLGGKLVIGDSVRGNVTSRIRHRAWTNSDLNWLMAIRSKSSVPVAAPVKSICLISRNSSS